MIGEIDNFLVRNGIEFDSSIISDNNTIFYFLDGFIVCEAKIHRGTIPPSVEIFEAKNKLTKGRNNEEKNAKIGNTWRFK